MAEGEQNRLVKKNGRKPSVIWEHYGFEESNVEQKHIVCKICRKVVSVPFGNTTNLLNHLKLSHKVIYDETIKNQKDKSGAATTS